jgi:UDP-glucose 4-epimerase
VELLDRRDDVPILNVGTGIGHSLTQVHEVVEAVTGASVVLERLPGRPFDIPAIVLDVTALRTVIPWQPRTLTEGVELTWNAHLESRRASDRTSGPSSHPGN